MYIPDAFTAKNLAWAHKLMSAHSFATLVSEGTSGLTASHLPLLCSNKDGGKGIIEGHMARANPQWQDFTENTEVLAIFTGHHAYISPTWYNSTPAVPTWNYAVVHAYGLPNLIDDKRAIRALLKRMVGTFDAHPNRAWPSDEAHEKLVQAMIPDVIAFEIPIARLQAKSKLSQNRPVADRPRII
ncbi:uncharacterized protein METZ01_LOCUS407801, partial [marine metagenome]